MLTAIIMAAGFSRRMGQNKLCLNYKSKPIFQYTLESVKNSAIHHTIVVTNQQLIIDYCIKHKLDHVFNKSPEIGQSQSIKLGVEAAPPDSNLMFFVADQPLLTTKTINHLVDSHHIFPNKIIIPKYKNTIGNPKIFPNSLRKSLLSLTEDVRGSKIIQENPQLVKYIEIDDERSFFDIDTVEDYKKLIE